MFNDVVQACQRKILKPSCVEAVLVGKGGEAAHSSDGDASPEAEAHILISPPATTGLTDCLQMPAIPSFLCFAICSARLLCSSHLGPLQLGYKHGKGFCPALCQVDASTHSASAYKPVHLLQGAGPCLLPSGPHSEPLFMAAASPSKPHCFLSPLGTLLPSHTAM